MTYEEIVKKAQSMIEGCDASNIPGHLAVEIDITGEGEGAFYFELKDGQLFVEPYEYYDHDCKFIMSAKTFIRMMEGNLDSVLAFTTGKLKIERSIEKALEFQKLMGTLEKQTKAKAKTAKTAKTAKA